MPFKKFERYSENQEEISQKDILTLRVASQYLFNMLYYLIQFFTLNLSLDLKIDPKTCIFENLEEISQKPVATMYKHLLKK